MLYHFTKLPRPEYSGSFAAVVCSERTRLYGRCRQTVFDPGSAIRCYYHRKLDRKLISS